MNKALSATTIKEYLPAIQKIRAFIELRLKNPDFENKKRLTVYGFGDEHGATEIAAATSIVCNWIGKTGIIRDPDGPLTSSFTKTKDSDTWSKMFEVVDKNVKRYDEPTKTPPRKKIGRNFPIEITLSAIGDLSLKRRVYPLREGLCLSVLRRLVTADGNPLKTSELLVLSPSKSKESVRKAITAFNDRTEALLGIEERLIEGRSKSGYRIHPKYRIVLRK